MADATYQPKVYRKQGGEEIVIADGGTLRVESGGTLVLESGSTATLANGIEEPGDIALTTGSIIIGASNVGAALDMKADGAILIGNGTTAAAKTTSGDAKIANDGSITIQAKAVKNTMIALAAGTIAVGTKTSGDVTALDISAEGAMALGQGAGETAAAYAMSGDVTMTKGGVTAIGANKVLTAMIADANVTNAKLANGAGLGAIVTAGLGNSVSYTKATDGTQTILADNATKDRGVLVVAVVDEVFADGNGGQTVIEIGEEDAIDKCFDHTVLASASAGAVFCKGFLNTAGKDIIATVSKATGTGTGGASFAVLALPNS